LKGKSTEKQWFKIFKILRQNKEMTIKNISKELHIPESSVRRILSEFMAIGRVETVKKPCFYRLKSDDKIPNLE